MDYEKTLKEIEEFILYKAGHLLDEDTEHRFVKYLEKQKEQKSDGKAMLHVAEKSYQIGLRDGRMKQNAEPFSWGHENGDSKKTNNQWSEEDEKNLELVTDCVYEFYPDPVMKYWLRDWLKSLRPQPHWKPSEEQMEALYKVIEFFQENKYICDPILSLYEQLKKL